MLIRALRVPKEIKRERPIIGVLAVRGALGFSRRPGRGHSDMPPTGT